MWILKSPEDARGSSDGNVEPQSDAIVWARVATIDLHERVEDGAKAVSRNADASVAYANADLEVVLMTFDGDLATLIGQARGDPNYEIPIERRPQP